MQLLYEKSLFIFRRDLRLTDNTGLIAALSQSKIVIPCFIVDPRQVGAENKFRSMNAIQFMIESLQDLNLQLQQRNAQLYIFYGPAPEIVKKLIKQESIDAVFVNTDYTPFSHKRDKDIEKNCYAQDVVFHSSADLLLNEPGIIKNKQGKPYSIFTSFYKTASMIQVEKPVLNRHNNYCTQKINGHEVHAALFKKILPTKNKLIHVHGGRKNGLSYLKRLKKLSTYEDTHNIPRINTTNLSAYIKFGTISIREVYCAIVKQIGITSPLLRQLYWRDFFTTVAYYSPSVFGKPFHKKYAAIPWDNSKDMFEKWCKGVTGFPIVDAGMRQLNTTGFMHNRVRMIVASFLVKDLHIDWLWGERYFAQQLVDYDPAVNNGNWQWCAGTGCDAQPYFRIFNPWLQQKKFDPDCVYIKKWIPELQKLSPKEIHAWYDVGYNVRHKFLIANIDYPRPIVDHATASKLVVHLFGGCN